MAQIVNGGGPRQRRADIPKPRYLREATAAAEAAGEILVRSFGQQQWILQVMEAVQRAVDIGVKQLGQQPAVASNEMSIQNGTGYRFNARTREELIQSRQIAAEERGIDPRSQFSQLHDPTKELGAPSLDDVVTPRDDGCMVSASGLILPAGAGSGVGYAHERAHLPPPEPQPESQPASEEDWLL